MKILEDDPLKRAAQDLSEAISQPAEAVRDAITSSILSHIPLLNIATGVLPALGQQKFQRQVNEVVQEIVSRIAELESQGLGQKEKLDQIRALLLQRLELMLKEFGDELTSELTRSGRIKLHDRAPSHDQQIEAQALLQNVAGRSAAIRVINPTTESDKLGQTLLKLFLSAGWSCQLSSSSMQSSVNGRLQILTGLQYDLSAHFGDLREIIIQTLAILGLDSASAQPQGFKGMHIPGFTARSQPTVDVSIFVYPNEI